MANVDKVTLNGTDYTIVDSTVPSWAKASTKPTYTASEISGLANVATSGSYNDLSNKPTIPAAQVQSDWNAASGMGAILNKPTIPTKVSDLTNDSGFITSQRTLINIGWSAGNLVFTDVDNNTLTHAQVISILHDTTKDVVITNNFSDTDNPEYVQLHLYQTIDEGNDCYTYRFCSIDVNTSRWFYFALFEDDGVLSIDEMYYDELATTSSLATVATSGSYNDLADKPTIPAAYDDTALAARVTVLEGQTHNVTYNQSTTTLTIQ